MSAASFSSRPYHYRDHRTDGVMDAGARSASDAIACMARPAFSVCPSTRCTSSSLPRESAPEMLRTGASPAHHPGPHQLPADRPRWSASSPTRRRRSAWTRGRARGRRISSRIWTCRRELFGEIVRPGTVLGPLSTAPAPSLGRPRRGRARLSRYRVGVRLGRSRRRHGVPELRHVVAPWNRDAGAGHHGSQSRSELHE